MEEREERERERKTTLMEVNDSFKILNFISPAFRKMFTYVYFYLCDKLGEGLDMGGEFVVLI